MDKRVRSPNYPGLSLPDAIQRIHQLYKAQHTHAAPRDVIAKSIGYNSLNGASAIHKYGLLEKVGDGMKVSERGMTIIAPHNPSEKAQAIRQAALEPRLFAELFEKFPPPLPNDEVLRNYLIRGGFAPQAVSAVVLSYRETMDLVDREEVGYAAPSITADVGQPMETAAVITAPKEPYRTSGLVASNQEKTRDLGRWPFEDGTWVQILAAENVDTEQALDMAELLIQIRRKELQRRKSAAADNSSKDENESA